MAKNITIKHYHSETANQKPTASSLDYGEIAINHRDKKIYIKDTNNSVVAIGDDIPRVTIVSSTGASESSVMSQKAVTDALSLKANASSLGSYATLSDLNGYAKTADVTKTLTIQRNSVTVDTYDGTATKTINISVPSAVSLNSSTGTSTTAGMTQKAITDALSNKANSSSLSSYITSDDVPVDYSTGSYSMVLKNSMNSATGASSVALGYRSKAYGKYSFAEGYNGTVIGDYSHVEGSGCTASGKWGAHAEGQMTTATSDDAHSEGCGTYAGHNHTHAEGIDTSAMTDNCHAEGNKSLASGSTSHAEGWGTMALGQMSHAQGGSTTALSEYCHSEGWGTLASGNCSHAENNNTQAIGRYTHAGGYGSVANPDYSFVHGNRVSATTNEAQVVFGRYNITRTDAALIIGYGSSSAAKNIFEIKTNGDVYITKSNTLVKLQDLL